MRRVFWKTSDPLCPFHLHLGLDNPWFYIHTQSPSEGQLTRLHYFLPPGGPVFENGPPEMVHARPLCCDYILPWRFSHYLRVFASTHYPYRPSNVLCLPDLAPACLLWPSSTTSSSSLTRYYHGPFAFLESFIHRSSYNCLLSFRSQFNCHSPDHLGNAESHPSLSCVTPFIPFKAPIAGTKPFLRFIASLWRQGTLTFFFATTSPRPRTSLAHSKSTVKVFSWISHVSQVSLSSFSCCSVRFWFSGYLNVCFSKEGTWLHSYLFSIWTRKLVILLILWNLTPKPLMIMNMYWKF